MPVILVQPSGFAGISEGSPLEWMYRCTSCGTVRTFAAPTVDLIRQQIASAGWKVDPMHGRFECPTCWTAYEHSVMQASKGNT